MATFTGTAGADVADSPNGVIVGFIGGTVNELVDFVGDSFLGGDGDDKIYSGHADDIITGGLGDDDLRGGGGNNRFIYNSDAEVGTDRVTGQSTSDTIVINFSGLGDLSGATFLGVERLELSDGGHDLTMPKLAFNVRAGSGVDILRFQGQNVDLLRARPETG